MAIIAVSRRPRISSDLSHTCDRVSAQNDDSVGGGSAPTRRRGAELKLTVADGGLSKHPGNALLVVVDGTGVDVSPNSAPSSPFHPLPFPSICSSFSSTFLPHPFSAEQGQVYLGPRYQVTK